MGGDPDAASRLVRQTTIDDAIAFYEAFAHTAVRVIETDDLDVNDPAVAGELVSRGMTLYDVMAYSAPRDMVAAEWVRDFALTRRTADLLFSDGRGRAAIPSVFLRLMAEEPDTFIAKKFGLDRARQVRDRAAGVLSGESGVDEFDEYCIREGINPGSLADIMIAGLFVALSQGWEWDR